MEGVWATGVAGRERRRGLLPCSAGSQSHFPSAPPSSPFPTLRISLSRPIHRNDQLRRQGRETGGYAHKQRTQQHSVGRSLVAHGAHSHACLTRIDVFVRLLMLQPSTHSPDTITFTSGSRQSHSRSAARAAGQQRGRDADRSSLRSSCCSSDSNAKQAASYYILRFGFEYVACQSPLCCAYSTHSVAAFRRVADTPFSLAFSFRPRPRDGSP